jgi:sugar phosphate isomerase/epimerase
VLRFGGPVFTNASDPIALALAHKAKGYTAAYAPPLKLQDTDRIRAVRRAFEAHDIMIAEVGFWENMLDLDERTRRANRRSMAEALALAEELNARCAVNLCGSYCRGNSGSHSPRNFSQEAFDEAVRMARGFIDEVRPRRAFFAYEIFPFNVVDSPQGIARLVQAVDRKQFGVHLDLANLISCPRAYWTSGDILRECIRLFGDRIVSAHAKDIRMRMPSISVILEEVIPGMGMLDIAACLRELGKLPRVVPYMMEHLESQEQYDRAAAHIRSVAAAEGINL